MKKKIIPNENRCRYCKGVVQGLSLCGCGGRERDTNIWKNPRRDKNRGIGQGGSPKNLIKFNRKK